MDGIARSKYRHVDFVKQKIAIVDDLQYPLFINSKFTSLTVVTLPAKQLFDTKSETCW
jgi:hypothetical protein